MNITVRMDSSRVAGVFGFYVEVCVWDAPSAEEALAATQRTIHMICDGKRTFFRCMPECNTAKEFDTKKTHHSGYARFTVLDEPGSWEPIAEKNRIPWLGTAKLREDSYGQEIDQG